MAYLKIKNNNLTSIEVALNNLLNFYGATNWRARNELISDEI